MDQMKMDVAGGRVVRREMRSRKLAVVVALQNLLVAACLVVTLCVYWGVPAPEHKQYVHIKFQPVPDIQGNVTVQFGPIDSKHMMDLVKEKNDKIYINCTGPYVWYINVCHVSLNNKNETGGELRLQVAGDKTVGTIILPRSRADCRGLHSIVNLRAKEEASLHLISDKDFKLKNVTVGLSYLLGRDCDF